MELWKEIFCNLLQKETDQIHLAAQDTISGKF